MLTEIQSYLQQSPIVSSILTGIISSGVFLVVLSRLKPSLRISTSICFDKENNKYLFKIINKSPFFKVFDISVKLYSIEIVPTYNGENYKMEPVKLTLDHIKAIQRLNCSHYFQDYFCKDKRLETRTDYAAIFSTSVDLMPLLQQKSFIRFQVYAKHTLTGFGRIFNYDYKHSGNIVDGSFLSGNTFKIKSS